MSIIIFLKFFLKKNWSDALELKEVRQCMEEELGYHAYCREMHAKVVALRYEMRKHWTLPNERQLRYTGPDWPVHLLNSVDSDARAKVLLLFWCAYVAHPERRHAWAG
jgi:hypothetical protein